MTYKVLVVDDSSFFQTRLKEIINECPDLEVIGFASNGQEAIDKDAALKPDVISMDYEMPYVDGITAVRHILEKRSVPIIMFSSMTYEGARITLEALDAGAVDFIPKNFAEVSNNSAYLKSKLHETLLTFARNARPSASPAPAITPPSPSTSAPARSSQASSRTAASSSASNSISALRERRAELSASRPATASAQRTSAEPTERNAPSETAAPSRPQSLRGKVKLLAIGASTGGPVAVTDIIKNLPASFPAPIVIVQHMPENFTRAFAERLNKQSALTVKEAENGDKLAQGLVLVAPGGKQLMFDKNKNSVKIIAGDDRVNYKPCVDISFASAAQVFGSGVLGVVLTGMGADGCEGARLLKQRGASIWSQNKDTCVVYGMPAAVESAGLSDCVYAIGEFAGKLSSGL